MPGCTSKVRACEPMRSFFFICRKRTILKKKPVHLCYAISLCVFALCCFGCRSDRNHANKHKSEEIVCVVLAHPDDETMISGTLAMLAGKGFDLTIVYVTSGDDGPDETGRGLSGNALGFVRENEAVQALYSIGVEKPPLFFNIPDGHVHEYTDSIEQKLRDLFGRISPQVVISFGPDGITGSRDHTFTGVAADMVFNQTQSGVLLLHMAITTPLPPFYANGVAVPRKDVDVCVRVSKYNKQRIQAIDAHQTQFNNRVRSSYLILVHTMRKEKFIIASNRGADEWLGKCF